MMNNRNLLIAALGLFSLVSAYAETENGVNANAGEEIVHDELSDWKNDSSEVILVRDKSKGFVQGKEVEEAFDRLLARAKDDTVWLSYIEPFLFEGREFGSSTGYAVGSDEAVLN